MKEEKLRLCLCTTPDQGLASYSNEMANSTGFHQGNQVQTLSVLQTLDTDASCLCCYQRT